MVFPSQFKQLLQFFLISIDLGFDGVDSLGGLLVRDLQRVQVTCEIVGLLLACEVLLDAENESLSRKWVLSDRLLP